MGARSIAEWRLEAPLGCAGASPPATTARLPSGGGKNRRRDDGDLEPLPNPLRTAIHDRSGLHLQIDAKRNDAENVMEQKVAARRNRWPDELKEGRKCGISTATAQPRSAGELA